jgi:hypothetical protein
MESRIQGAIEHLVRYPKAPVARLAREFGVSRHRLQNRLEGVPPKMGHAGINLKLTELIVHLNLAVRPKFITDAANAILQARSGKNAKALPKRGCYWTNREVTCSGAYANR